MSAPSSREESILYALFAAGAFVGLGKLLASDEKMTVRKAVGHGIVSGGLGVAASLILIPLPEVPLPVLFGAACALASMGASTLTAMVQRYIERK